MDNAVKDVYWTWESPDGKIVLGICDGNSIVYQTDSGNFGYVDIVCDWTEKFDTVEEAQKYYDEQVVLKWLK